MLDPLPTSQVLTPLLPSFLMHDGSAVAVAGVVMFDVP